MEYYDPSEVGIDELTKRIRVGSKTKEFLIELHNITFLARKTTLPYQDYLSKVSCYRDCSQPQHGLFIHNDLSTVNCS